MKVAEQFATCGAADLLAAGFGRARELNWQARYRAALYTQAQMAFEGRPDMSALRSLYDTMVSYWRIARAGTLATAPTVLSQTRTSIALTGLYVLMDTIGPRCALSSRFCAQYLHGTHGYCRRQCANPVDAIQGSKDLD